MIEIKIPKNINEYDPKFIGMFTFRQSIALAITLPICIWIFNEFKDVSMDLAGGLCMIPAAFAWLFGWFKIYNMRFEQFLMTAAINCIIAPTKRKYMTDNIYTRVYKDDDKQNNKAVKKKKKYKKSKQAIR